MKRLLDGRWGLAAVLLGSACPGDDGDSGSTAATVTTTEATQGSESTSNASMGSTTTPAEGTSTTTDASTTATTTTTTTTTPPADSTGAEPVACGDMMCPAGEVCVTEEFEDCEDQDPQAPGECPPGTEPDLCGLAGVPCCCGEPPPPAEVCVPGPECDDEPDCPCITCPAGKACYTNVTDNSISCGPPRL